MPFDYLVHDGGPEPCPALCIGESCLFEDEFNDRLQKLIDFANEELDDEEISE